MALLPFNTELAAGTLTRDSFVHYMVQDAHYLVGFSRALAVAAAKAEDPDRIVQFLDAAREAIVAERALHGSYFKHWGMSSDDFMNAPLSPTTHHYVSYLLATAMREPYEVVLAAVLPCFWIYAEVGTAVSAKAAPNNPYQEWIDTYSCEDFQAAVRGVIGAVDEAAAGATADRQTAMHAAYTTCTRLEYMFWDAAHRIERWPL